MSHSRTLLHSILVAVIGLASARLGHAGSGNKLVELEGVELSIPEGWKQTTKGGATVLAPIKSKGRAIDVIRLKAMPAATPEAVVAAINAKGKIEMTGAKEVVRDGQKLVIGDGKTVTAAGKPAIAVGVVILPVKDHAVMLMSFVEPDQDPLITKANVEILLSARASGPKISVVYTAPKAKGLVAIPPEFVKKFESTMPLLDHLYMLPRPLPIKFEECGSVNAYYNKDSHSIRICHEFYDDLLKLFAGAGMDEKKSLEVATNTMLFAFFHEFGHALVGEFDLPITGRGEDAADEIATIMLSGDKGSKAALAAAVWFHTNAEKKHRNNFTDEHALDEQRIASIACLLYGADNAKYKPFVTGLKMTPTRLVKCNRDWAARKKAWTTLLTPHMRLK
jgi:hypothetical protein